MRDETMEEAARSIISGYIEDIIGYMDSSNDGMLAPWMMAKMRCHEMEDALQAVCDSIASQPGPGQRALRAVALQDMDLEFIEAEHISAAKPDPFFSASSVFDDALNMVRPPA